MWEWLVNYGGFLGMPSMKDISTIPGRFNQWRREGQQEPTSYGGPPEPYSPMGRREGLLPPMQTGFIAEVPTPEEYRRRRR